MDTCATLLRHGGKGIVYCNSRKEAAEVAGALRKAHRQRRSCSITPECRRPSGTKSNGCFARGRFASWWRRRRSARASICPTCEHVVLYHLNFDFTEFNQQAGRAGRDGAPAQIHLLFGESDRRINEYLIDRDAPTLSALRQMYRGMRELARDGILRGGNTDIAALLDLDKVRDRTVAAALRIFSDSSLVEVGEDDEGRFIRFLAVRGKIDMQENERFAEGEATRESFDRFCSLALSAPADSLERIINRPIYPSRVEHRR